MCLCNVQFRFCVVHRAFQKVYLNILLSVLQLVLYSSSGILTASSVNAESSDSLFPMFSNLLDVTSNSAPPSESPLLLVQTSLSRHRRLFEPKAIVLRVQYLLHPKGPNFPESGSCGTDRSALCATRYLRAACTHGQQKWRSAEFSVFPSEMPPSTIFFAHQYSLHRDESTERCTYVRSLYR